MRWFSIQHDLRDRGRHADLFRRSRIARLFHSTSRRHVVGFSVSVGLMFTGSSIALYAHYLPLPHVVSDVLGYAVHGIGLIPFARHAEPLFVILMGE